MNKKIKTILMGTPEFALTIFEKFHSALQDRFEIIAVITAPDKPVGRKQVLTPSPVKKWALENNLKILQPEKIREPKWIEKIKELKPDLIILTAYGQIIPKEILDIPKYGALNIHPSLLPQYRGASPIQATILNGDKETGVTIILMDEEMDHGDIVAKSKVKKAKPPQAYQKSKITYEELSNQLADASSDLLIKTLPDWIEGKIKAKPQDHSKATFCKIIKKEDGKIDWNKSAEEIERMVRAFEAWPNAYTFWNEKQIKILGVELVNKKTENKPGKVFLDENKQLAIQAGKAILVLKQVQLQGKKAMSAQDFLHGRPEIIGAVLQ